MPLTLFARRFTLLAACVSCLCAALIASPLQAAPARAWPSYGRAEANEYEDQTVRAAQYLLRARGYPVAADGVFGKSTDAAVRRFQRSHHLIADGILRPPTWEALVVRVAPGASGPAVSAAQGSAPCGRLRRAGRWTVRPPDEGRRA